MRRRARRLHRIRSLRTVLPWVMLLWMAASAVAQVSVPELTGRVVDRADILPAPTESGLTAMLSDHEARTGNQVAVLTLPSLKGEPIEAVALRVARTWELGTAEFDNGALLLVAVNDRRLRIEVGNGLTGTLTDLMAGRLIRHEIRPAFRKGDYAGGVTAGVTAIVGLIEGTYEPPSGGGSGGDTMPLFGRILFALFFVVMPLVAFAPSFLLAGRWGGLLFVSVFFVAGCAILFASFWAVPLSALFYLMLVGAAEWMLRRQEGWRDARAELREDKGRTVEVNLGGLTFTAVGITSGSGSSSAASGGGGSFSGGGASGSW